MKLYGWTGFVPQRYLPEGHRAQQASMFVAMPTDKAWRERFRYGYSEFKNYVNVMDAREDHSNVGAALAVASPGSWFAQDTWNHTPGENVWVELQGAPW